MESAVSVSSTVEIVGLQYPLDQTEDKRKRNDNIYKLVSSGYSIEYVSGLYGLSKNCIRQIYCKEMMKQSELYAYFKSTPLGNRQARHLTRLMYRLGVNTVADFQSRSLLSLLDSTDGIKLPVMEALIKARNPESFRLYEFIKENRPVHHFKQKFYFILIGVGVETLQDFCVYKLHKLYYAKGTGDVTVGVLKKLQEQAKAMLSSE